LEKHCIDHLRRNKRGWISPLRRRNLQAYGPVSAHYGDISKRSQNLRIKRKECGGRRRSGTKGGEGGRSLELILTPSAVRRPRGDIAQRAYPEAEGEVVARALPKKTHVVVVGVAGEIFYCLVGFWGHLVLLPPQASSTRGRGRGRRHLS